ncbi:MAG: UvrB/UvrC motif-containing protein [Phycisphaerales bacterium]
MPGPFQNFPTPPERRLSESDDTKDLTPLFEEWPFEPGQLSVRVIQGLDGAPRLQMRVDLGILQMELRGRPDGQRPDGFESLLELHETRLDHHDEEDDFVLSPEDCRFLREEAAQFYHRYISLLVLGDYSGVIRDTTRNMRLLDFCREYAEADEDREILEPFRSYITMMRARAIAGQAVTDDEPKAALLAIDDGLEAVRKVYESQGRLDAYETAHEVELLRGMRAELSKKLPTSQRSELKKRLQEALERENYELAAILRDELKSLRE